MKAVRIHEFGDADVLKYEDVEKPKPGSDEVLIQLFASGVNPVDYKIRKGERKEKFPSTLPQILGWDGSGVIEETGADVSGFNKGDEVYSRPDPTKNGTYAEYVTVKANQVGFKPKSIDHVHAAGVPLAGLTAWQGLFDFGKLEKGQKVLIHAASGGVGTFAVQFAKWKGAHVTGTTSKENIDFVKQLGADEVIDYKDEKFENKLSDIDLVFDTISGETQTRSLKVLKNGGRLITTLKAENSDEAKAKNIHIEGYTAQSYPEQLNQIAQLIDTGKIKVIVTEVFKLSEAAKAQAMIESGHTKGKIILKII